MKTLALAILITLSAALTASAIPAGAFPARGLVTFKLLAYGQNANYQLVGAKTNATATTTNITSVYKSSVTNLPVGSDDILGLLENSFNTNFPADARLYLSGTGFLVMDAAGTNLYLNASTVLSLHIHSRGVHAGLETVLQTINTNGFTYSGKDGELYTEIFDLTYDDTSLTPADGTQTNFELSGLVGLKFQRNLMTGVYQTAFVFNGQGDGWVRNNWKIFKGTITSVGVSAAP